MQCPYPGETTATTVSQGRRGKQGRQGRHRLTQIKGKGGYKEKSVAIGEICG